MKKDTSIQNTSVTVIGGGPAGLTAAYELGKRDAPVVVLEKSDQVGGISRTETYKGYRFDIGGHRFYTKVGEVEALWHEILGDGFIERERLSRIYYNDKFYPYPLKLWPTLKNLGVAESLKIMMSYLEAKFRVRVAARAGLTDAPEDNLEQWVSNRFGERLYHMFFKTYTEKVWGIPCDQIRADWAAQRIKGLSVKRAVLNALFKNDEETSLIEQFHYPIYGPGMMWERCAELVEQEHGNEVRMETEVVRVEHEPAGSNHSETVNGTANGVSDSLSSGKQRRVARVITRTADGEEHALESEHFVNSMPITELIKRLDPTPPQAVLDAADGLSYRDFLTVALVVDHPDLFPDNWIYIHSPEVMVGRIQNFKNWSPAMVPDASKTCLGMEYFCHEGDGLWEASNEDLVAQAERELRRIGLAKGAPIIDGTVVRQKKTYPVYDGTYKEHLAVIQAYLEGFENLQTVGRAGMHRYNNQDHSMLTAILAARNIAGEHTPTGQPHDLWNVNVERSYHEDFTVEEKKEYDAAQAPSNAKEEKEVTHA